MISKYITFLVFGMCFALSTASRPMPTPEQLAYQHMEIGAMISFDMYTFAPNSSIDYVPSPEVFYPEGLDTDTWLQAAQYFHAKYAVLTAKHDVGFCLWPTQAPNYNYSIQYTSWGHGNRDIVKEFIASCKKFNIKPAIYYSIATNFYKGVVYGRVVSNNTEEQQAYNELALFQLSELWTNYGDLVELWFDGGLIPVSQGGPDVAPLIEKLQPNAVAFNAPDRYQQCVRWIGNEDGIAYGPTWSTCDADTICVNGGSGSPTANFWCPAECDTPLRGNGAHQWFWLPDGELYVKTLDQLHDEYIRSVGHNCNYLLNINPNQQGLVDAVDMQRYVEFGAILSAYTKDNELASISGVAYTIQLPFDQPTYVDTIVIQEDQSFGELVYNYTVSALVNGNWVSCSNGSSIGHKKIDPITPVLTKLLQLQVTEAADIPHILRFAAYFVGPTKRYEMQP